MLKSIYYGETCVERLDCLKTGSLVVGAVVLKTSIFVPKIIVFEDIVVAVLT